MALIILELKPDIIAGFNSEFFDWTFIELRAKILGIDLNDFSEVLRWRKLMNNRPAVIKGMNIGNEIGKEPDKKLTDEEYENLFGDKQYTKR